MTYTPIIPARYASSRLPAKPLLDIAGKPMLARVNEKVQQTPAKRILVATDHQPIADVAISAGAEVYMTRETHQSGTERLAEAVTRHAMRCRTRR